MKEFTSTVTLTFEINNLSAFDKEEYIERLKEQYIELYDLEIKDHEITNIEEYTLEATEYGKASVEDRNLETVFAVR